MDITYWERLLKNVGLFFSKKKLMDWSRLLANLSNSLNLWGSTNLNPFSINSEYFTAGEASFIILSTFSLGTTFAFLLIDLSNFIFYNNFWVEILRVVSLLLGVLIFLVFSFEFFELNNSLAESLNSLGDLFTLLFLWLELEWIGASLSPSSSIPLVGNLILGSVIPFLREELEKIDPIKVPEGFCFIIEPALFIFSDFFMESKFGRLFALLRRSTFYLILLIKFYVLVETSPLPTPPFFFLLEKPIGKLIGECLECSFSEKILSMWRIVFARLRVLWGVSNLIDLKDFLFEVLVSSSSKFSIPFLNWDGDLESKSGLFNLGLYYMVSSLTSSTYTLLESLLD